VWFLYLFGKSYDNNFSFQHALKALVSELAD